jgi:hypothetical protein
MFFYWLYHIVAGSITVAVFWFRSCNFRVYTQERKQCVKGNPKKVKKWNPMKTVILSFLSSGGQSTWKMSFRLWSNFPSWVLSKSLWTRVLHSIGCHGLSTHKCCTTAKFNIDSWTTSSISPKKQFKFNYSLRSVGANQIWCFYVHMADIERHVKRKKLRIRSY